MHVYAYALRRRLEFRDVGSFLHLPPLPLPPPPTPIPSLPRRGEWITGVARACSAGILRVRERAESGAK
jgi:hypothetical protein